MFCVYFFTEEEKLLYNDTGSGDSPPLLFVLKENKTPTLYLNLKGDRIWHLYYLFRGRAYRRQIYVKKDIKQ